MPEVESAMLNLHQHDGNRRAPVCERCDDESAGVAEVLVAVLELCVGLLGNAVVDVAVPVEAQLLNNNNNNVY